MIRNIFIDLDDTLWDTRSNNRDSLQVLFDDNDWQRWATSFDQFFSIYEVHNEALWRAYRNKEITKHQLSRDRFAYPLSHFGIPFTNRILSAIGRTFLALSQHQTKLVDGALELLEELKKREYKIFLISNGFKEIQQNKLRNSGLLGYFDQLFISEEVGFHKPNPSFFHRALSGSNSRRRESLVVGDSLEVDILGADEAWLPSIWYNPKGLPMDLPIKMYPPLVAQHLSEVPQLIDKLQETTSL